MKKFLNLIRVVLSMPLLLLLLLVTFITPIAISISKLADANYLTKIISEVGLFDDLAESMIEEFQLEEALYDGETSVSISNVFEEISIGDYMEDYTEIIVTELYAWMDGDKEIFIAEIDAEPLVNDIFVKMGVGDEFEGFAANETLKSTITLEDLDISESDIDELKDGYKYMKSLGIISILVLVVTWGITAIMLPGIKNGIKISNIFVILGAVSIFLITFAINVPMVLDFVQDESISTEEIVVATNMAEIVVEITKNVRVSSLALIGVPLLLNILLKISTTRSKEKYNKSMAKTDNSSNTI